MFLKVKIEDKSLIINLGKDLTKAQDLVQMFEKNAVVVKENYSSVCKVEVSSTIELGSEIKFEKSGYSGEETNLIISAESSISGAVNADANLFVDIDTINKKHIEQVAKLRKEIELLNSTVSVLNSKIEEFESVDE